MQALLPGLRLSGTGRFYTRTSKARVPRPILVGKPDRLAEVAAICIPWVSPILPGGNPWRGDARLWSGGSVKMAGTGDRGGPILPPTADGAPDGLGGSPHN